MFKFARADGPKKPSSAFSSSPRGPIIKMATTDTPAQEGCSCCFVRCCTCIHFSFLASTVGLVKLVQTLLSGVIQYLLIEYGLRYHATIGTAFEGSLTTSSACFFTSAILLFIYIVSERSYRLIRASLFEIMFNIVSCFFYLTSAVYMAFATKIFVWTISFTTPSVYYGMTGVYALSTVAGILHGADAFYSFKDFVAH
ncbi:hypothetical protein TKK_0016772 [Trichogramma kaykai]